MGSEPPFLGDPGAPRPPDHTEVFPGHASWQREQLMVREGREDAQAGAFYITGDISNT